MTKAKSLLCLLPILSILLIAGCKKEEPFQETPFTGPPTGNWKVYHMTDDHRVIKSFISDSVRYREYTQHTRYIFHENPDSITIHNSHNILELKLNTSGNYEVVTNFAESSTERLKYSLTWNFDEININEEEKLDTELSSVKTTFTWTPGQTNSSAFSEYAVLAFGSKSYKVSASEQTLMPFDVLESVEYKNDTAIYTKRDYMWFMNPM
jgi:hypothetical protein